MALTGLERPMLVELQWVHPCFCIDSVDHVHEGQISLISPLAHGNGFATGLYEISSGEGISHFVKELRSQERVKQVRMVEEQGNKALIYLRTKQDSLLIETIARTGCIPLEPSLTREGVDSCAIYAPSEGELKNLYSMLKDNYEVKLLSKRYLHPGQNKQAVYSGFREMLELKTLSSQLSPRQLELFSYAVHKGYFDSPRKISIEDIAANVGVSPATASEHLRKVETKVMPVFAQMFGRMR